MTVKIKKIGKDGHSEIDVTPEQAIEMCTAEEGRYFVIDSKTKQLVKEINIKDGQELMLVPIIRGG